VLTTKVKNIGKKVNFEGAEKEEFWALDDVSFDIHQGDRVGIIGRNGAGKSTLLKILGRITEPTKGIIDIRGRVASLLEVGTGFHPELTGRENIFLNGAILGMNRMEIKSKFDEIVAFAEVEKFIDTPVKHYSSGMYVRLAFAVAAHLEPEILVVDEVLAVGDADFQKKCIGKMENVSKGEGRTILFVSHNMAAVKQLCNKGIVLTKGKLSFLGTQHQALNYYQSTGDSSSTFVHTGPLHQAPGNSQIRVLEFRIVPTSGEIISISSGVSYELKFYNCIQNANIDVTFELRTLDETIVFHNGTIISSSRNSREGIYTIKGMLDPYVLNSGIFKFKLIFGRDQRHRLYQVQDFIQFEVLNEMKGSNAAQTPGVVFLKIPYEVSFTKL